MRYDKFGRISVTESQLCDVLYSDPTVDLSLFLVENPEIFNQSVIANHYEIPLLEKYHDLEIDIHQFDRKNQAQWHVPDEYLEMDIAKWLLDQCKTEPQLQRVAQELLIFQEKNLFILLKYLKYLVDTMRKNNIVWGVGRGSSVASYVLYLIGIHRIDSLYYDLPIEEFLKD